MKRVPGSLRGVKSLIAQATRERSLIFLAPV
jgi:hypothetical protein